MTEKTHNYQYNIDLDSDTAPARVVRMIGTQKKVLEIGAGPGSITRHLSRTNQCDVTALEIDPSAIKILEPYCNRVVIANLNQPDWLNQFEGEKFDVVLAADVLEHVYNPATVLQQMKTLLNSDGSIVLSLPHIGFSAIHACLLNEDFEENDWGLLDKTHIRFFGIKNIQRLFDNANLLINQAEFVIRDPGQTEFSGLWKKTSSQLKQELAKNKFGNVYQVVVRGQVKNSDHKGLDLIQIKPEKPALMSLKAQTILFLQHNLPQPIKKTIKNLLRLLAIKR